MQTGQTNNDSKLLMKINFEIISIFLEYDNWHQALKQVFALVGTHVNVDRIYYFEIHEEPLTKAKLTSQRFEWVKAGVEPMIDNPDLQDLPIEVVEDFMKPILINTPFVANVRELPEGNTKEILASQDILSILVLPININNKLFGFIGFDDCTSERNWSEEELHFLKSITSNLSTAISRRNALIEVERKAIELTRINEELEQFAYVASHDLQEPLRMISEFLKLFEKKYFYTLDEKGKTYIQYALEGSVRMKKIILDLLEFSRVGKSNQILEEVDVANLVDDLKSLYIIKIESTNTEITLTNVKKILCWRSPLELVLMNLFDNALKYAKPDFSPKIEITMEENESKWIFHFTDYGIGIDPKYYDRIFVIFQRLHTKDEYEGSGMGLAITKKIIENMGGEIWVDSENGISTTFHFSILKQPNK
jgi:signal transduction histidine kinase